MSSSLPPNETSLDSHCRACLSNEIGVDLVSIQEPEIKRLFELSSVSLDEDNPLPRQICEYCVRRFCEWDFFRSIVLESDRQLRQTLSDKLPVLNEVDDVQFMYMDWEEVTPDAPLVEPKAGELTNPEAVIAPVKNDVKPEQKDVDPPKAVKIVTKDAVISETIQAKKDAKEAVEPQKAVKFLVLEGVLKKPVNPDEKDLSTAAQPAEKSLSTAADPPKAVKIVAKDDKTQLKVENKEKSGQKTVTPKTAAVSPSVKPVSSSKSGMTLKEILASKQSSTSSSAKAATPKSTTLQKPATSTSKPSTTKSSTKPAVSSSNKAEKPISSQVISSSTSRNVEQSKKCPAKKIRAKSPIKAPGSSPKRESTQTLKRKISSEVVEVRPPKERDHSRSPEVYEYYCRQCGPIMTDDHYRHNDLHYIKSLTVVCANDVYRHDHHRDNPDNWDRVYRKEESLYDVDRSRQRRSHFF